MSNNLNQLFNVWKDKHLTEANWQDTFPMKSEVIPPESFKRSFCTDGFLGDNISACDILFICKESNLEDNGVLKESLDNYFWFNDVVNCKFNESEYLYNNSEKINVTVRRSATKYYNTFHRLLNIFYTSKDKISLKNCGYMNLNKRGGYSTCNKNSLNRYVNKYKDEILKEIQILSPNLIVCCGDITYNCFKGIFDNIFEEKRNLFHKRHGNFRSFKFDLDGKIVSVFEFYHPSASFSYKEVCLSQNSSTNNAVTIPTTPTPLSKTETISNI